MTTGGKLLIGTLVAGALGGLAYLGRRFWVPALRDSKGPLANCNSRTLVVGDSLTAFQQSYADQLKSVCPGMQQTKIARSGEKTDWMLQQMKSDIIPGKYDLVVIWGGINDIYARNSIDQAKKNLQAMYDLAKANGAKVVALTVIPTRTYTNATTKTITLTRELNNWILGNTSIDGVVDSNALVNDGNDGVRTGFLQSDTLHLTQAAHTEIMKNFNQKILNPIPI